VRRKQSARLSVLIFFILLMLIFALIIVGCSNREEQLRAEFEKLEQENIELRVQNEHLANINKEHENEIKMHIKAEELRNSMDILAREIIEALYNRDMDNLKTYLCDNAIIDSKRVIFKIDNHQNEVEYLSKEVQLEKLRQRYYFMDKDEKYITGYEIINPVFENVSIMELTFVNKNGEWKLFDVGNDV